MISDLRFEHFKFSNLNLEFEIFGPDVKLDDSE